MIDETKLITLLEREVTDSYVAVHKAKTEGTTGVENTSYLLGWLNAIEHATDLVKKLATVPPRADGGTSEQQH